MSPRPISLLALLFGLSLTADGARAGGSPPDGAADSGNPQRSAAAPILKVETGSACPHLATRKAELEADPASLSRAQTVLPSGTIDGNEHPELIPDEVAFRLFMRSLALPKGALPSEATRVQTSLQNVGFEGNQIDAILSIANEYARRVETFHTAPTPQDPSFQNQEVDALARELLDSLASKLPPEAAERLRQHIAGEVKRHIKIVPGRTN